MSSSAIVKFGEMLTKSVNISTIGAGGPILIVGHRSGEEAARSGNW